MDLKRISNPARLEVAGVARRFGQQTVLEDIAFTVQPGEIFVIMGPSGAGKSVLLRLLAGLDTPDAGSVKVDGAEAAAPTTRDRVRTALVFQSGALFNSLSLYDNLALYPREHRLASEDEIRRKVTDALEALSLSHAADKLPAELSGGMRKRAAVARALVMEPQLILFDEPTSELDPILAATTAELIATVRRESGVTTVVVTHDRALASGIGDRVALLQAGRFGFIGTPRELAACARPEVRAFLEPVIDLERPRFRRGEKSEAKAVAPESLRKPGA